MERNPRPVLGGEGRLFCFVGNVFSWSGAGDGIEVEPVTHTADCLDVFGMTGIVFNSLAQPAHMDVQGAGIAGVIGFPRFANNSCGLRLRRDGP